MPHPHKCGTCFTLHTALTHGSVHTKTCSHTASPLQLFTSAWAKRHQNLGTKSVGTAKGAWHKRLHSLYRLRTSRTTHAAGNHWPNSHHTYSFALRPGLSGRVRHMHSPASAPGHEEWDGNLHRPTGTLPCIQRGLRLLTHCCSSNHTSQTVGEAHAPYSLLALASHNHATTVKHTACSAMLSQCGWSPSAQP